MPIIPVSSMPLSRDGYYATNNQFQVAGPRGFTEFKLLENEDLFFRVDFPGVPNDGVKYKVVMKKLVFITADAPKEHKHDAGARQYLTATGLSCDCCEITNVQASTVDGVLRMVLSKKKLPGKEKDSLRTSSSCPVDGDTHISGGHISDGEVWTGRVLRNNPHVVKGPNRVYESKQLQNGGLYIRIDLPGVPGEGFKLIVEDGNILFSAKASHVTEHDLDGRHYIGKVAALTSGSGPGRKIKSQVKNGVLRLTIPPS